MTPDQMLAKASELTGLADYGPQDFMDGLRRGLAAFAKISLTPKARHGLEAKIVGDLANRLRIEDWYKAHPELAHERIEGPLLVCGLPRTGTTATVAMLALDERFRFLRGWEGRSPVPPPTLGEESTDPRAVAAREAAKDYTEQALHLFDPDGPEEDLVMLASLNVHSFHGMLPTPEDYIRWWIEADFGPTYAYHARTLKLLQSRRPPNAWLLKAPAHLFHLEAFAAQYPESRIVMTHRDPAKVVASNASLFHSLYAKFCTPESLDKQWTGARSLWLWTEGMRRALAARERIGEHRFIDVYNRDVVRDPIGTFEALYDKLGFSLGPQLRARLEDYHRQKAQGAFGEHRYTAEEYGLDDRRIRDAFKDYIDRFKL